MTDRDSADYQQMKAAWHELYGGSVKHDHPSEEFSEGWTGGAQAAASADNESCDVLHTADHLAIVEAQESIRAALAVMDASSYGDPETPFRMRAALTQPKE